MTEILIFLFENAEKIGVGILSLFAIYVLHNQSGRETQVQNRLLDVIDKQSVNHGKLAEHDEKILEMLEKQQIEAKQRDTKDTEAREAQQAFWRDANVVLKELSSTMGHMSTAQSKSNSLLEGAITDLTAVTRDHTQEVRSSRIASEAAQVATETTQRLLRENEERRNADTALLAEIITDLTVSIKGMKDEIVKQLKLSADEAKQDHVKMLNQFRVLEVMNKDVKDLANNVKSLQMIERVQSSDENATLILNNADDDSDTPPLKDTA